MLTMNDFDSLLRFFKVLGDESRLRMLGLIAERERSVGELAALLSITEPTASHHLSRLKELNLVQKRRERNTHFHRLNQDALQDLRKVVFTPQAVASMVDTGGGKSPERKVLDTFLDGERLKKIPATRKKREVILRWLVDRFEPGVRYSEKELNALIKRHHPDCATLRRELVASKHMKRDKGVYWRL